MKKTLLLVPALLCALAWPAAGQDPAPVGDQLSRFTLQQKSERAVFNKKQAEERRVLRESLKDKTPEESQARYQALRSSQKDERKNFNKEQRDRKRAFLKEKGLSFRGRRKTAGP